MGRVKRHDRKATVTQISAHYLQETLKERWATAEEDHSGCHSCQLRTGKLQFRQAFLEHSRIVHYTMFHGPIFESRFSENPD